MSNLIITIIALALFSAFLTAGANYINPATLEDFVNKHTIRSSLFQYSSGVMNYKLMHGKYPVSAEQIIPDLIRNPKLPKNMTLSEFKNNYVNGTVELCFDVGINSENSLKMLKSISGDEQGANFVISDSCGSTTEDLPIDFPADKKITYIIR